MSRTRRDHTACSGFSRFYIGVHDNDFGHDAKSGCKPPSWWKRIRRQKRRAQEHQAMRDGHEVPRFRHTDMWEWN